MKLQILGLALVVVTLVVLTGTASGLQESDTRPPPPEEDATLIFLERLAENGKRLADKAIGTVLELLNDSNQQKVKHVAKDIWNKAAQALKEVLEG